MEEMDRNRMVQGTQVCAGNSVYVVPDAELPAFRLKRSLESVSHEEGFKLKQLR